MVAVLKVELILLNMFSEHKSATFWYAIYKASV